LTFASLGLSITSTTVIVGLRFPLVSPFQIRMRWQSGGTVPWQRVLDRARRFRKYRISCRCCYTPYIILSSAAALETPVPWIPSHHWPLLILNHCCDDQQVHPFGASGPAAAIPAVQSPPPASLISHRLPTNHHIHKTNARTTQTPHLLTVCSICKPPPPHPTTSAPLRPSHPHWPRPTRSITTAMCPTAAATRRSTTGSSRVCKIHNACVREAVYD